MKKWVLLALSSVLMVNAQADQSYCGYKDYFHLSNQTHPGIYIVSGYSDQDVILLMGPRSFILKDGYACRTGYAHVTIGYDTNNMCTLDITDGPYINHPSISASCNGLHYLGTDYDGNNSYTINFD